MTLPLPFLSPQTARFAPIPEALRDAFFPAKLCLFEWTDYWFSWAGATHLLVGQRKVEPFAPGLFQVRWENALGLSQIQPYRHNEALEAPLPLEILSPKFPRPKVHLAFYSALLDDLYARCVHLPFDLMGETWRGVETSELAPSPLWTQIYLEQHGARLCAALSRYLAQPPQEWRTERHAQNAAQIKRADAAMLIELSRDASSWTRTGKTLQAVRATQELTYERLDTPDNRFVAGFAADLKRALDALEPGKYLGLRGLCAAVMARFPFFGQGTPVPTPSLERRSASREAVELWRLWQGAGAPLFARFERAARTRDIATLYEFWVFFALCEELGSLRGETPRLELVTNEKRGLTPLSKAHFENGTLLFNGPAPSYSTPLRPDFLWLENGCPSLAFDAKFRLDERDANGESGGRGVDLHKMHAYRDALGVRCALAIHPGDKSVFFRRGIGDSNFVDLAVLMKAECEGVGMWAKRPGLVEP